jgi:hypothetical protein
MTMRAGTNLRTLPLLPAFASVLLDSRGKTGKLKTQGNPSSFFRAAAVF